MTIETKKIKRDHRGVVVMGSNRKGNLNTGDLRGTGKWGFSLGTGEGDEYRKKVK